MIKRGKSRHELGTLSKKRDEVERDIRTHGTTDNYQALDIRERLLFLVVLGTGQRGANWEPTIVTADKA